jgi:hypothetical protein
MIRCAAEGIRRASLMEAPATAALVRLPYQSSHVGCRLCTPAKMAVALANGSPRSSLPSALGVLRWTGARGGGAARRSYSHSQGGDADGRRGPPPPLLRGPGPGTPGLAGKSPSGILALRRTRGEP